MKIIDKRNKLKQHKTKKYRKRSLKRVKSIAVHHSATLTGSSEAFARYHVTHNDWAGIGYHYVINKNGQIDWCNDIGLKTYHVGNSNSIAIGVCLVGNFTKENPTKAQLVSLIELSEYLLEEVPSINQILKHQDYPDYSWKECPAFEVNLLTIPFIDNKKVNPNKPLDRVFHNYFID